MPIFLKNQSVCLKIKQKSEPFYKITTYNQKNNKNKNAQLF